MQKKKSFAIFVRLSLSDKQYENENEKKNVYTNTLRRDSKAF